MAVEDELRSARGYAMGHSALRGLETVDVWPTLLNYELWLHIQADPESTLAREVGALLAAREPITDAIVEDLARAYLPSARLEAQVGEAGDALSGELGAVAQAIDEARGSAGAYAAQLGRAHGRLSDGLNKAALARLLQDLAGATQQAMQGTARLERRLADSSAEVRKLRDALEHARQEAATDGLSNLANRRAFDEEMRNACADGESGPLTLALLDIDNFKTVNDSWGHQTGDEVIRFVAGIVARVGAPPRFAARLGGDEFALIFRGEPAHDVERILAEALSEIAARPLLRRATGEPLGAVTVSAGFASRLPGEAPAALSERADQALYAAKRGGRNRVVSAASGDPAPAAAPAGAASSGPASSGPASSGPAPKAAPSDGARQRVLRALRS